MAAPFLRAQVRGQAAAHAMPEGVARGQHHHPPAPRGQHRGHIKRQGPGAATRIDGGQLQMAGAAKYQLSLVQCQLSRCAEA